MEDEDWVEFLGVGSVFHLSDRGSDKPKHPLGFYVPEETMTAYRERLKAGVYGPPVEEKPKAPKRQTTKRPPAAKRGPAKP